MALEVGLSSRAGLQAVEVVEGTAVRLGARGRHDLSQLIRESLDQLKVTTAGL
jgi:hypothetical protein